MTAVTRLFVLRHGLVTEHWLARLYGDMDVPLSPEGEAQARASAALLEGVELAAVISSGLERAEFTAALLRSPRGLPRRDEPDLRELCRGAWSGLTFDELDAASPGAFRAWHAAPSTSRPPDGESLDDLAGRVVPRLQALALEHAGGALAVVAHSWVLRVALCHTLGLPASAAKRFNIPPAGLCQLDWPAEPAQPSSTDARRPTLSGMSLDRIPDQQISGYRGPGEAASR